MAEFVMEAAEKLPSTRAAVSGREWESKFNYVANTFEAGTAVKIAVFDTKQGAGRVKAAALGTPKKPATIDLPGGVEAWTIMAVEEEAVTTAEDAKTPSFKEAGLKEGDTYRTGRSELWGQFAGYAVEDEGEGEE